MRHRTRQPAARPAIAQAIRRQSFFSRQDQLWTNICQRRQHKPPLGQTRVRQREHVALHRDVAGVNHVQIDRTRCISRIADGPAQLPFDVAATALTATSGGKESAHSISMTAFKNAPASASHPTGSVSNTREDFTGSHAQRDTRARAARRFSSRSPTFDPSAIPARMIHFKPSTSCMS